MDLNKIFGVFFQKSWESTHEKCDFSLMQELTGVSVQQIILFSGSSLI